MATVNLGRIKPVFRGAYSGSTAYVVDDIVTHGNETYICIQAHGAGTQAVTQTSYWTKLAAKGTDGTDVGTTITTQGDILYRDASGLQRPAKPASDKFLKNTSGGVLSWADAGGLVSTSVKNFNSNASFSTGNSWTDFDSSFRPDIVIANSGSKLLITGHLCGMTFSSNDSMYVKLQAQYDTGGGTSYGSFSDESSTGTDDSTALTAVQQGSSAVLGFAASSGNSNVNGDGADTLTFCYQWTHGQNAGTRIRMRMLVRTRNTNARINYTHNNDGNALSSLSQFGLMEVNV